MNVQVHAKNFHLSDRLQDYADKKLARLERYLPHIVQITLELAEERRHGSSGVVAQLTVRDKRGTVLRVEERGQDQAEAAVDSAVDKMYRQISRYKDRSRRRTGEKFAEVFPEFAAAESLPEFEEASETPARIVRRKQMEMIPMSEQEAMDQMELLGHDFFVFYNAGSNTINVLYRRKQGDYGLIEPQVR